MKPGKDELVRVRSESELRAGLTVWKKPCGRCGKDHATILLRSLPHSRGRWLCSPAGECSGERGWEAAGDCPPTAGSNGRQCFWRAIAEGRLYRLRDLDDQQEQQHTKQREREDA